MELIELPNELILKIIYKLDYIDILKLYSVSKHIKNIIDTHLYSIYMSLKKNSSKLCGYPLYQPGDWNEEFNFKIFTQIYVDTIKKKKRALIILRYIHKWLTNELIDSPMDRSAIPYSMSAAISNCFHQLYPEKNEIYSKLRKTVLRGIPSQSSNYHRHLKNIIEEYIPEDLLNSFNISRIEVPGFRFHEKFNYDNPIINIYNKDFTSLDKYEIKINKYDTKLFHIY